MKFKKLVERIDNAVADVQGTPRNPQKPGTRNHLGASIVGRDCVRELVYSFRQMTKVRHEGRILRLFGRGHDEEPRFVELLEMIGCVVRSLDPATGKQMQFIGYKGHFAGSLDGDVTNVPDVEEFGLTQEDVLLAEYKTHGEKSFKLLVADGVQKSKPEHYVQCQVYMKEKGYKAALYLAVNKNTDDIHAEIIMLDPLVSIVANRTAAEVIDARILPPRIPYAGPSFYRCMFCDHKATCHMGAVAPKSCRSCAFGFAVDNGQWECSKWGAIPPAIVPQGCDAWKQITD